MLSLKSEFSNSQQWVCSFYIIKYVTNINSLRYRPFSDGQKIGQHINLVNLVNLRVLARFHENSKNTEKMRVFQIVTIEYGE